MISSSIKVKKSQNIIYPCSIKREPGIHKVLIGKLFRALTLKYQHVYLGETKKFELI